MVYIDIFSGCGGLSLGLLNAGWEGLFAIEKYQDAFSTFRHNLIDNDNHFNWPEWLSVEKHDINDILTSYADQLEGLQGHVDLVAGGPPCQGFSMAGKRVRNDQRNRLVKSYIRFIELVRPRAIVFENVHGFTVKFAEKDKKKTKKYSSYVERRLQALGYSTHHEIIDMSEYGVPQKRKRFILVGLLNGEPKDVFEHLQNDKHDFLQGKNLTETPTIQDAIGDLKKQWGTTPSPDTKNFNAGVYGEISSPYQQIMRQNVVINAGNAVDSHRFVNHRQSIINLHEDLQRVAPRGKRITPTDNIVENLHRRGVTVLDDNSIAPTITSIPDELVHYSEPRILTVREHARIQSFPDSFVFKGKYTSGGKLRKQEVPRYTQVGNAIPPLFAEQIGHALIEVLEDE